VRLVVPYSLDVNPADTRLIRLTECLGGQYELLRLENGVAVSPEFIEKHVEDKNSCFVVNPAAIRECLSSEIFPADLASYLTSQFALVLVHNLSSDSFSASTVSTFSKGNLDAVQPVESSGLSYEIAPGDKQVCGAFSGLTFGPVNKTNDRVFTEVLDSGDVRTHVAIGGRPCFASIARDRAEVFFLAGANVADLDANIDGKFLADYFSQLVPPAMFIRYAFREEGWVPFQHHATFIIDDPLLWKDYGFLNYERLLGLMDEYNFHTSIAFIPHNCRRNSLGVTRMFRERADRYSICFHGNDHTAAEFATDDVGLLNAMLTVAEERMDVHQKKTGIQCDKVMVFPQENFSPAALAVLEAHNFSAAVNSGPYPLGNRTGHTIADVIEPAILKYGGFPLFLRKYVREIALQDVAFNLFFGKPVLIVEHHDLFKDPECLTQLISRIHTLAPEIQWSNLQTAIESSYLKRWTPEKTLQVRAYSNTGKIENASDSVLRCSVEWPRCGGISAEKVLVDGMPWVDTQMDSKGIRASFDLPPRGSRKFSVCYRNDFGMSDVTRGVQWRTNAFFRRRLSEIRDNHLSKNPHLLSVAKILQRHFLKGSNY
jgi:hypothetical protein